MCVMTRSRSDLKILIVEDNEKDRKLLGLTLLHLGFQNIIQATGGLEGLELAKKHMPDLIFLDIIMPRIDGARVKESLKENPKTRHIPIIFSSSIISKDEERRLGGYSGGSIIVAKPYSSEEILAAIEKTAESGLLYP